MISSDAEVNKMLGTASIYGPALRMAAYQRGMPKANRASLATVFYWLRKNVPPPAPGLHQGL